MKVYRVVLKDGAWCAFTPGQAQPVVCCDDKAILVQCVRTLGRKYSGQVYIYDEEGGLELVHSFGEISYQAEPSVASDRRITNSIS